MLKPSYLKGAFALSIAAFLSKLLGIFYVIPLKHLAGDYGLALYQAVFPIYNTLLMLSVSGIPIALAKLISENQAKRKPNEVVSIMKTSFCLMIAVAVCGFFFLVGGAPRIAKWLGNPDTQLSIEALGLAMLFVPFVAVLRGYFYGIQHMRLSAVSQVLEQMIRVIVMVSLVYWLMREKEDMAVVASGAALSSAAGLAVSLVLLLWAYAPLAKRLPRQAGRQARYVGRILAIAVPASFSTLMIPLMGMIDSLTIINLLRETGMDLAAATAQFGVYSRGAPLVQFAAFYAGGLAVAAVPAFASSQAEERTVYIFRTLKITLLIGLPASLGMMAIARPLNLLFYGDDSGSGILLLLAASGFFLSLSVTVSGILQGLGRQLLPAISLAAGLAVKLWMNRWLVPEYGIAGAAYGTIVSYALISLICLAALRHVHPVSWGVGRNLLKWTMPALFMAMFIFGIFHGDDSAAVHVDNRAESFYLVGWMVAAGITSYVAGLFLFKAVTWREIRQYDIAHIRKQKGGTQGE